MEAHSHVETKLTIRKKILFSSVMLAILFLAFEIGFRVFLESESQIEDDPYLSISEGAPLFIEATDPTTGDALMKTAPYKIPLFQEQRFSKKKGDRVYRIFSMGGSTTYGRPYDDRTSFSGWMRETLPIADPSKEWEIINAGGVSYASYRVAALMEEIAQYEPDLFIVYTGQNEFLEKRRYADSILSKQALQGANTLLSHSSIYRIMKKGIERASGRQVGRSRNETLMPGEVETILEKSIGPQSYHRDDPHKRKAIEHFRSNLERMIAIARSSGAEILFVTPASNVKDCSPFKSEPKEGLSLQESSDFESLLDQARARMQAEEWDAALATLDSAATIDDRQAILHYLKGNALYRIGNYNEAESAFERAIEEDVCPLRAIRPIADAVKRIATESDALLVDFEILVSNASPQRIPGQELFIDHVHPTIEGNRLLANAILDTFSNNGLLSYGDDWEGESSLAEIKRTVETDLDPLFHGRALRNLARIYRWAGKFEEGYRLAKQAILHLPHDPETLYLLGSNALDAGHHAEAVVNLEKSLIGTGDDAQAIIRNNLGNAYLALGRWDEAIAAYRESIELDSNYISSAANLAQALHRVGDFESAIAQYGIALENNPNNAETMNNLGSIYLDTNRMQDAQDILEQALQLDPNLYETLLNLALVSIKRNHIEEAKSRLEKAIAIRPTAYEAYLKLGELFMKTGEVPEATKIFGQAMRIDPDAPDAYHLAALSLAREGRFSEARPISLQAIERAPQWTEAVGLAAELALARQAFTEAAKGEALALALNAAALSEEKDPKILATLTRAHLLNEQPLKARETARKAKEHAERLGMQSLGEQIATQFAALLGSENP